MSERVPEEWVETEIGQIIKAIAEGGTPSTSNPDYFGGNIPWVVIDDIRPQIHDTAKKITELGLSKSSAKLWDRGTIILSTGATIGRVGIAMRPLVTKQGICGIVLNDGVDNNFFFHYLVSIERQLNFLSQGSTIKETRPPTIKKIGLNLPPFLEQKKIASILTSVDEVIENTQKQIDKLQDLKKATMNGLLTKGIDHTEFKDSGLGRIPKSWEIVDLDRNLELMTDYVANGSFEALRNNVVVLEVPSFAFYVRLYDLRLGLGHQSQKYIDEESYKFLKKSSLKENDILIANIGTVGEVFLMQSTRLPASIAPNMILMRCSSDTIPAFLFYFMNSDAGKKSISNTIAGSGQPKINKTELKRILSVLPPMDEQKQITSVLLAQEKDIQSKHKKLDHLKFLKNALMQDLFTGKVRAKVD